MDSDVTLLLPSPNNIEIEKSITVPTFYTLLSFAGGGKKYIYTHTYIHICTDTHTYKINVMNLNKDTLCK